MKGLGYHAGKRWLWVCQIASKRGALPEVVGDAGLLIEDPLDAREWADAICQVNQNQILRAALIERGIAASGIGPGKRLLTRHSGFIKRLAKS